MFQRRCTCRFFVVLVLWLPKNICSSWFLSSPPYISIHAACKFRPLANPREAPASQAVRFEDSRGIYKRNGKCVGRITKPYFKASSAGGSYSGKAASAGGACGFAQHDEPLHYSQGGERTGPTWRRRWRSGGTADHLVVRRPPR